MNLTKGYTVHVAVKSASVEMLNGMLVVVATRADTGKKVFHLGPDNEGFRNRMKALAFAHQTTREGIDFYNEEG